MIKLDVNNGVCTMDMGMDKLVRPVALCRCEGAENKKLE